MKINHLFFRLVTIFLLCLTSNCQQQSDLYVRAEKKTQRPTKAIQAYVLVPKESPSKSESIEENHSPRISFIKTVYYLGDVGQGTKNTCEFRFTNTGRGLLKIGQISRTCGCTVFHLDKKQYPPNESGVIKVIYTAGKFPL
jgi:hypothetical protein